jgi:hypothetical protein
VKHLELTELPETVRALQQISLPKKLYRVNEHRVQLYKTCDSRIISAKLPPEIRNLDYSLRSILADVFGLNVERGYLSKLCTKKVSAALEPVYGDVLEAMPE